MTRYLGQNHFEHGKVERTGILLCNVGTPEHPTPRAVRRYLAKFLGDPRIVELPRWLWMPLLHGVILNIRPRRSARAYAAVWQADGAPLLKLSERLVAGLESNLSTAGGGNLVFALGMRYGQPSIADALDRLINLQARRLLVVPLYPQYASATTASAHDAIFAHCQRLRWLPELRFVSNYHEDRGYIAALAESVNTHWQQQGRGQRLLMSFHGIPYDTFLAGDPYYCQCRATARLLAESLGLGDADWQISFQSRVGPKRWLEPYTAKTLTDWGRQNLGDIDVICPGFAVDCLETLEEIALQYAGVYRKAGGGKLRYIPALNDSAAHIDALSALILGHLDGWSERASDPAQAQRAAAERARRDGAR